MSVLSKSGLYIQEIADKDFLVKGFQEVAKNPYHKDNNPKGIINLGTAENKLMYDVLSKKLAEPDLHIWRKDMLMYSNIAGYYEFRETIAEFLTKRTNAVTPLDPNKMAVMNGCGSVIETIAFAVSDAGDVWLTPAPYYGGLLTDSCLRAKVDIFPVHLYSKIEENETQQYELTPEKLEKCLKDARSKDLNVRGLFLMNPQNPLGIIYSKEVISACLKFCNKHSLHIIFDEIYLTGGFVEDVQTTSILQFKPEDIPDPERTHFIWGFSKDFAMSGMRVGLYYGFSDVVRKQILSQCRFTQIPGFIQIMLSKMLKDEDWVDNVYYPTNQKRLKEGYEIVTRELKSIGVPYLEACSGLYVYCDFRKFLKENTIEMEEDLWMKFIAAGVYICPSQAFFSDEFGWFRVIFADEKVKLELSMERIKKVCSELQRG
ncbi:1-aminocyclopropane-1-carboxylate synthase-like protein 1 [Antedon mediterranea]|uniref:1-aminocyclopropane-1-carboxylate synthase-like protein 1 n=1 Tax=Antedon mediterranea TaxID=105859 RepID=UPI003AF5579B